MRSPQDQKNNLNSKKIFKLIKGYFLNSNEKFVAWLLLMGTALCVISLVGLMFAFSWWTTGFWALLTAKAALTPFLISLGQFTLIAGAYIGASVLQSFLMGKLSIRWRNWLTKQFINKLFDGKNNYLDLKRISTTIDNIGQRIQADINNFVTLTLNIGTTLLNSVLSLCAFTGSLWVIGGAIQIGLLGLNLVIPGYLVWVSLIIAAIATGLTYVIGKTLPQENKKNEQAEADLRQDLSQLNQEAENIAEEHAEDYYKTSLAKMTEEVKNTATQKLNTMTRLSAFQNFYSQFSNILPTIFAAPLYFSGLIQIGQLMQIGICFNQVNTALSALMYSYGDLASCRASFERIVELQKTFENDGLPLANEKSIYRKVRNKNSITLKNLDIMQPQVQPLSSSYIMRGLTLKLQPSEHVLIQGPSGIGKSTLFKVISGTWQYGKGKISVPENNDKKFYFLPQKPVLPHATLEAVLAYPQPTNMYTRPQYEEVLKNVRGMDDFIPRLDEKRDWKELSGGQQQRISFARALLKKPEWLFLDEATSALDAEGEDHVYRKVKEKLKNTTIVSIGHRDTIKKYHSRIVFFKATQDKQIELKMEIEPRPSDSSSFSVLNP